MDLTDKDRERWRQEYLNEVGTMPPCPLCGRATRVARSDYVRCPQCTTQWLDGEDLSLDPRMQRAEKLAASTPVIAGTQKPDASGVTTAKLSYEARTAAQAWKQLGKRATEGHHVACLCPLCVKVRAEAVDGGLKKTPAAATVAVVKSETA